MTPNSKQLKTTENPLVSFCVSTYKRFDLVERMITELLKQTYENFEIVICDNDPKGSTKKVIDTFKANKIKYFVNKKNLGMVDSFNRAFKLSKGDFIVFMSDDDPPYPFMLEKLIHIYKKYPNCDAYFGAYDLYTPDAKLAKTIHMPNGLLSCRNFDWPKGVIKIMTPKTYLKKALDGEIFYYLMWSTGIVKREIVEKIGAIPRYGSALMTDRSYCLKVGALSKIAIYNKELASQLVHNNSFSLTSADADILIKGFVGYYKDIQRYLRPYSLEEENKKFLIRHLINMFLIIKVGDEIRKQKTNSIFLMNVFDQIAKELPFIRSYRLKLKIMLWKRTPFELIFKSLDMSPEKLFKVAKKFITFRVLRTNTTF